MTRPPDAKGRALEAARKFLESPECADHGPLCSGQLAAAMLRFCEARDRRKLERSNDPQEGSLYQIVAGDEAEARDAAEELERE